MRGGCLPGSRSLPRRSSSWTPTASASGWPPASPSSGWWRCRSASAGNSWTGKVWGRAGWPGVRPPARLFACPPVCPSVCRSGCLAEWPHTFEVVMVDQCGVSGIGQHCQPLTAHAHHPRFFKFLGALKKKRRLVGGDPKNVGWMHHMYG